ncbi:hypothetical protein XAP6164_5590004 [Xanthomonas phaseoli pv. phaseoli]|nr:hypothetical protein XAP6164_5590004 [Xanthomonas phaseoli pv. phaseoli]
MKLHSVLPTCAAEGSGSRRGSVGAGSVLAADDVASVAPAPTAAVAAMPRRRKVLRSIVTPSNDRGPSCARCCTASCDGGQTPVRKSAHRPDAWTADGCARGGPECAMTLASQTTRHAVAGFEAHAGDADLAATACRCVPLAVGYAIDASVLRIAVHRTRYPAARTTRAWR